MSRIVIEDLPVAEAMSPEELMEIYGGASSFWATLAVGASLAMGAQQMDNPMADSAKLMDGLAFGGEPVMSEVVDQLGSMGTGSAVEAMVTDLKKLRDVQDALGTTDRSRDVLAGMQAEGVDLGLGGDDAELLETAQTMTKMLQGLLTMLDRVSGGESDAGRGAQALDDLSAMIDSELTYKRAS